MFLIQTALPYEQEMDSFEQMLTCQLDELINSISLNNNIFFLEWIGECIT